jgi:O-antigen/teichoic acid export membrane protein
LRFRRERIAGDWRRNWALARWALAALLAASLTPYVAPWLLAAWHSEAEVGTLAACMSLVGLSQMFLIGIGNWLSPQAARAFALGGVVKLRGVLLWTGIVYAVIIGGLCLLFIVAGNWLVVLVYGSQYAGCGNVVSVTALAILAHSLGNVAGNGLWAMEQPRALLAADSVMLLVTLAVALAAIGPMGALGAALAALAGAVAGAAVRTASLLRRMPLAMPSPGVSA